jgi:biopolymer transport protein TolQ
MATQSTLEHMSVWGLVTEASIVVQAVMVCLVLASLISWYLIVQRGTALWRSEQLFKAFLKRFRQDDIGQVYRESNGKALPAEAGLQRIFLASYGTYADLQANHAAQPETVIDGVERSLYVAISEQEERLEKGLPFLATVGSVSPYIGLFGTVWGIMNSFLGLAQVQQATLSTVAPGIAEALIATAIGLFAAIPAVMAYNRFSARTQTLVARYYAFGNELQGRLHRQLHTAAPTFAAAA